MTKKTLELLELLREQYPHPDSAIIAEFQNMTGGYARRADAIAMHCWPSKGLELIGFEIKTSRADWLRELKQPEKAEAIKQFCDRWYLVIYEYEIVHFGFGFEQKEVPDDWGVMIRQWEGSGYKLKIKKEAPKLDPKPIDRLFLASLMRLASNPFNDVVINGRKYTVAPSP